MAKSPPLKGTAVEKLALSTKAPPAGVAITGNGTVWQYLYKNMTCNLSAGIQVRTLADNKGQQRSCLPGHHERGWAVCLAAS